MLRLLDSDKYSETLYLELTGTTDETLDVLDPLSCEVCRRMKVAIANVMTSSGRGRRSGHHLSAKTTDSSRCVYQRACLVADLVRLRARLDRVERYATMRVFTIPVFNNPHKNVRVPMDFVKMRGNISQAWHLYGAQGGVEETQSCLRLLRSGSQGRHTRWDEPI